MALIPPPGLIDGTLKRRILAARGGRAQFHHLVVESVEPLTADSVTITFAVPPELAQAYRFTPGQHVTIRSDHGAPDSRRSYSIAATPGGPLRIGVKVIPGGAFSGWAATTLRAGDRLEVMTPTGEFGIAPEPAVARHHVAVAAGSGITPIFSIVAALLAGEPDSAVTLLYGSRSSAEIMFTEDLADLKDAHPGRFQLLHTLSREPQSAVIRAGRLDAGKLADLIDAFGLRDADTWFLCGPAAAVTTWQQVLAATGVDPARVRRELFHAESAQAPRAVPVGAPATSTLTFTLDGRRSQVGLVAGETVLDAVLRVRADAPFACRGGVCGTCRAVVTEGSAAMDSNFALEGDELERGFVLTCQARPTAHALSVDYDR
ncbi:MAG: 2Fe-2S iron-sulfur cluster-binding protein [Sporichthyaceae bacterium]